MAVNSAPIFVPGHRWSPWPVARSGRALGRNAIEHNRTSHRSGAAGDPRLHRGRREPGDPGDERLGRRRAGVKAEPPGTPAGPGPAHGRDPPGRRPRGNRTGAGRAVGPGAVSGQGSRRLRRATAGSSSNAPVFDRPCGSAEPLRASSSRCRRNDRGAVTRPGRKSGRCSCCATDRDAVCRRECVQFSWTPLANR